MSTGPTGTQTDELLNAINGTGIAEANMLANPPTPGPTGPPVTISPSDVTMPPTVAEPVEPLHIATLEELMASHSVIVSKEKGDAGSLNALVSPTRDAFRPQLFQWAGAGFPDLYVIQTFPITPPAVCSDGVTRETGKYIEFCIGKDLGDVIAGMQVLMTGIQPSWSMEGNVLRIHVSRSS